MSEIQVHIGQIKIAKNGETLKALLGSCVGIGILWRERRLYGLAHCLLPKAPAATFEIGGRFVDQAVDSLLALMKIRPENEAEIEVVLAGGGNMTSPRGTRASELVGWHNVHAAREEISRRALRLVFHDTGGEEGRRLIIESATGVYRVEKIPRTEKVA